MYNAFMDAKVLEKRQQRHHVHENHHGTITIVRILTYGMAWVKEILAQSLLKGKFWGTLVGFVNPTYFREALLIGHIRKWRYKCSLRMI